MQVHRVRNIEYQPHPITALAFTPKSILTESGVCLLAVARDNGTIEIWNTLNGYYQERIIPGIRDSTVESLVWVHETDAWNDTTDLDTNTTTGYQEARLFSAGLDGQIREWDLNSLTSKYAVECNGGSVWCMQASPLTNLIAVGCEDGCVRLFKVLPPADSSYAHSSIMNQSLEYVRAFDKTDARILSLAWSPDAGYLICGTSDGSIRKMDVLTGRVVDRMVVDSKKREDTLVWSVIVLPNNTIVSGDSLGNVCFWDWNTCTLRQCLKAHGADVLCLATDEEGSCVYSSGVDRVIIQHKLTPSDRWIPSVKRRYHSHDVRALALFPSSPVDSLISGGVDTTLIISSPASKFDRVKQQRMSSWPVAPLVSLIKDVRWIVERRDAGVRIWSLGSGMKSSGIVTYPRVCTAQVAASDINEYQDKDRLPLLEKGKLLLDIKVKHMTTTLVSSAVSPNGKWVVLSDAHSVNLYKISISPAATLRVSKAKSFRTLLCGQAGAHRLIFTPNSETLVIASLNSKVNVVSISIDANGLDSFSLSSTFSMHVDSLITSLAISADGKWLASADLNKHIFITNLESLTLHGILPKIASSLTTCLAFSPDSQTLASTQTSNEIYQFSVHTRAFTEWSIENSDRIPRWLRQRKERISGVSFCDRESLVLYGVTYSCFVDLSKPASRVPDDEAKKRKREVSSSPLIEDACLEEEVADEVVVGEDEEVEVKTSETVISDQATASTGKVYNFVRIERFSPLMMLDFLAPGEMVVVERPLLKIMEGLPEGFFRSRYGT